MLTDVLKWFLICFFGLFVLWVLTGGPERGGGTSPIIGAPTGVGSPSFTTESASPN
ncbi:MAG: hypothetical protein R3B39_00750 [Candidatus Paceibacterota bacterium]